MNIHQKMKTIKIVSHVSSHRLSSICLVLAFAALGVYLIVGVHAQTPYASVEAESGTLSNGATAETDATASNGTYVQFSSPASANVANFNTIDYNNGVELTDGSFYQILDLQYDDTPSDPSYSPTYFANLHKENPNLKIVIYIDPIYSCGDAPADDVDGNANFGSTAYQSGCAAAAIAEAKSCGADGIFWDQIDATGDWTTSNGQDPSDYPTDAAWQGAVESFLSYVKTQLNDNGLISIGNVADWEDGSTTGIVWSAYNKDLDGGLEESWDSDGTSAGLSNGLWLIQEEEALWSSSQNKYIMMRDSAENSETGSNFGFASMLLVAPASNSLDSFSTTIIDNGAYFGDEADYPEFTTAKDIGAPTGSVSPSISPLPSSYTGASSSGGSVPSAQNSVYSRTFTNGLVLVNPTNGTLSYTLPSGTYSGSGDEPTNLSGTIQVPSLTGYILTKQ